MPHAFHLLRAVTVLLAAAGCLHAELPVAADAGIVAQPSGDQLAFFEKNIRPVLVSKCYKCHSDQAEKVKGGLLLDTREGIRRGGDSGHAVVPGNLNESLLINALHYTDKDLAMPPEKSGGKLPDDVIKDFEKWVLMGAPDPRDAGAKVVAKTIDWTKAREFWAFQQPRRASVPQPADRTWPRTDLDRFILCALEKKGLKPVSDAEPRALLRRVTFDLTGLPPSPAEVESFLAERSPDAFEKVIDRLLGSSQFGERWGRHWLDVARYGESTGKERNFTFPTAWRYRDWVIASLNADRPYDQFIREPIAALLTDLKAHGLLGDTLVMWGGEFGRTPDGRRPDGRDHNAKGYTMWLAGGGVRGGLSHGATDDYGYKAVENPMHVHDLHATTLHLLGLDHEKLTYRYAGRDFRLTDVHGHVVKEIFT